jgi:ABC-type nitrate/sulfonate/bicarbonate transport system substrate-binding protein
MMLRVLLAGLILLFSAGASRAQVTHVMSGYAAVSGPHAILWITRDAGLFEKNGLKADVAYIRSGSTHAQALVAGELQMGQMGGPAALAAGVAGMDLVFVAVALNNHSDCSHGNCFQDGGIERQGRWCNPLWLQHGYIGPLRDQKGGSPA